MLRLSGKEFFHATARQQGKVMAGKSNSGSWVLLLAYLGPKMGNSSPLPQMLPTTVVKHCMDEC